MLVTRNWLLLADTGSLFDPDLVAWSTNTRIRPHPHFSPCLPPPLSTVPAAQRGTSDLASSTAVATQGYGTAHMAEHQERGRCGGGSDCG